jgi:hypothetical protein
MAAHCSYHFVEAKLLQGVVMAKMILCLYDELSDARNAVRDLVKAGFAPESISLVARDVEGRYASELDQQESQTDEGLPEDEKEGVIAGGIIGGLAGMVLGLGALAIPGIGPIIAAGPLATMLLGAGAGTITGSLVGAIVEWEVPEEEATYYAEQVQQGRTLICVRAADDQADQVAGILNCHSPVDVQ